MIRKALILFLALILFYTLFLKFFAPSWWNTGHSDNQSNMIKAQDFLYSSHYHENVLVGSSLTNRLPQQDSSIGMCNLSFAGQSVFDGLEIIKHREVLPKRIFIETNLLSRSINGAFVDPLVSFIPLRLKEKLIVMREEVQPLAQVGVVLDYKFLVPMLLANTSMKIEGVEKKNEPEKKTEGSVKKSDFFDKMILQQKKALAGFTKENVDEQMIVFHNYVNYFKAKGVELVLYQMPINKELKNNVELLYIRKCLEEQFSNLTFIDVPPNIDFVTTDGTHLGKEESAIYYAYLKENINSILLKKN